MSAQRIGSLSHAGAAVMVTPSAGRSHRSANRVSSAARRTADRPGPAPPARFAPPARAPRRVMRTEPEAWVPGLQAGVIQCAAVFEDRVVLVGRAYAGHVAATGAQRDPAQLDVPGDGPADPLDICWHRLAGDRPPRRSGGTASSCFHRATAGRPAFHCRRSRRSPRSACINPGTPAGRYPCRTTATRAHATEWLTTLRDMRPGPRRGGHSWSQSCGCAR